MWGPGTGGVGNSPPVPWGQTEPTAAATAAGSWMDHGVSTPSSCRGGRSPSEDPQDPPPPELHQPKASAVPSVGLAVASHGRPLPRCRPLARWAVRWNSGRAPRAGARSVFLEGGGPESSGRRSRTLPARYARSAHIRPEHNRAPPFAQCAPAQSDRGMRKGRPFTRNDRPSGRRGDRPATTAGAGCPPPSPRPAGTPSARCSRWWPWRGAGRRRSSSSRPGCGTDR